MKTIQILFMVFTLLITYSCNSQTPKQKKQMEEAKKAAAEAQKIVDEMLKNNPEVKKMMEQGKEAAEKNTEKNKNQAAKKKEYAKKQVQHREEFYWKNKVGSNTNGKFNNWNWGNVDIAIYDGNGKMDSEMQYIDKKYIIIGNIGSNGQVTMNLPASISAPYPINKSLIREMHPLSNNDVKFSEPNVVFRNPGFTLSIIKDYKKLGDLYIGNSEKVTQNLAAPFSLSFGDEGYRLYWVYIKEACTANFDKNYEKIVEVGVETGETRKLDQTIIYDLEFKPGWNLIKSEIIGHHIYQGNNLFKLKKHTALTSLPNDAKYYFKYND